jgi:VanZ family protein
MVNLSELNNHARLPVAVLFTLAVTIALLTPGNAFPKLPLFPHADKLVHVGLFGTHTFIWMRTIKDFKIRKFYLLPLLLSFIFPILLEYLQIIVPNRSFDYMDLLANFAGGVIGFTGFIILYKAKSRLV